MGLFDKNRMGLVNVWYLDSVKVKGQEKPVVIYSVESIDDEHGGGVK